MAEQGGAEPPGGAAAAPSRRRRRRAVGPSGAPSGVPDEAAPGWSAEPQAPEDDDERLLREVPPHHGG